MNLATKKSIYYIISIVEYGLFAIFIISSYIGFLDFTHMTTILIMVVISVLARFLFAKYSEKELWSSKEKIKKLKKEVMERGSIDGNTKMTLKLLQKKIQDKDMNLDKAERYAEILFEEAQEGIVESNQKVFFSILNEMIDDLLDYINREEYQLIKFFMLTKKKNYGVWTIVYSSVTTACIIFAFLFNFASGLYLSSKYFAFLVVAVTLLYDIKRIHNKKFSNGQYRYRKNKKFLNYHNKIINLVCNNTKVRNFPEFQEIQSKLENLTSKIEFYNGYIESYHEIFRKYELLAIFGLFFTTLVAVIQNIFNVVSEIISFDLLNFILFVVIIYVLILNPIQRERKSLNIHQDIAKIEKELSVKLETLKLCHYIIIR